MTAFIAVLTIHLHFPLAGSLKGKRKELAGRLQERYGKAQDQAERDIDDWLQQG